MLTVSQWWRDLRTAQTETGQRERDELQRKFSLVLLRLSDNEHRAEHNDPAMKFRLNMRCLHFSLPKCQLTVRNVKVSHQFRKV